MMIILKYVLINPIMFVIDLIDYLIDVVFVHAKEQAKLSGCPPTDRPHTIPIEINDSSITYRSSRYVDKLFSFDDPNVNVYEVVT